MRKLFRRFLEFLFGKKTVPASTSKTIVKEPIVQSTEEKRKLIVEEMVRKEKEKSKAMVKAEKSDRKLQGRNNRLLIEYNGKAPIAGANMSITKCGKNGKRHVINRAGSMYKDRIDSLRCNDFDRARVIIGPFREYVKQAIFTDSYGKHFKVA